jgi:hypothetical protein
MRPDLRLPTHETAVGRIYPRLSNVRLETAEYIRSMARQLAQMAGGNRMPLVSYLLEMAYIEVHDIIRGARPADGEIAKAEPNTEIKEGLKSNMS